jgi:hypothetical protein
MIEVYPLLTMINRASLPPLPLFAKRTKLSTATSSSQCDFFVSVGRNDTQKVLRAFVERLTDALCKTVEWLKSSSKQLGE